MKKEYEHPRAEKFEFNYLENVVASGGDEVGVVEAGKNAWQACYTHNGNDKVQLKNKKC